MSLEETACEKGRERDKEQGQIQSRKPALPSGGEMSKERKRRDV